jgi:mannosyltransferase
VVQRQHSKIEEIDVIAPNFKRRLSGVTSTIIQLVPLQASMGVRIATLGPGLPAHLPYIRFRDLWCLWKKPYGNPSRVWHARRNVEMIGGLVLRDILRMPLKIIFTSASQRHHKGFTRFLINRMNAVIATSAKTARYLTVPNQIILHGIDTQKFAPPADKSAAKYAVSLNPERHHVGCFGRIRHQKGTDLFVETMILAMANNPKWDAVICGRATAEHLSFEQALKTRVANAGLTDRFIFAGEHTDIHRWYQAMDVFVAPQRWEGFGLTPLEAMASGVPVVATDVGAFSELVVDGQTGFIVAGFEANSISEALEPVMLDDRLLHRFSIAARAHIEANFELKGEAQAIARIYERLLTSPPTRHLSPA